MPVKPDVNEETLRLIITCLALALGTFVFIGGMTISRVLSRKMRMHSVKKKQIQEQTDIAEATGYEQAALEGESEDGEGVDSGLSSFGEHEKRSQEDKEDDDEDVDDDTGDAGSAIDSESDGDEEIQTDSRYQGSKDNLKSLDEQLDKTEGVPLGPEVSNKNATSRGVASDPTITMSPKLKSTSYSPSLSDQSSQSSRSQVSKWLLNFEE